MSAKPLPPGRPPGSLDLLDPESGSSPRDAESAENWRADALGRSRHSRLASEVREPLDDKDSERAERLCAQVTRDALGDFAPALLLLSSERRQRLQALTAWTVALFDFALRPGLAGLDGDRLAQINAWEFRTEEALDGNPPGQPVFVMMAREEEAAAWPREALDEIGAFARRMALSSQRVRTLDPSPAPPGEGNQRENPGQAIELGQALVAALLGVESAEDPAASALGLLVGLAIEAAGALSTSASGQPPSQWLEALEMVRIADGPRGWRRAASYTRRVLRARLRRGTPDERLGLATRLRFLALSIFL